jgi:hypothetical protein
MTLWQLLILICIAVPVGPALASAQHGRVGPGGYALAIAVGLAVGACCGWVMYATHETVGSKLQRLTSETSPAKQEWYFFGFYLAKFLWLALAGFLGFWLSSMLLRIVFGPV